MTTPLDEAVERHGEALFNLSDSIRESGMLDSDKHHQRYEATVKAWNDLRTILNALSPDEERVARAIWTAPLTGQPKGKSVRSWPPSNKDALTETMRQARAAIQSIVGERDD
jgi:hypothetical protein